MAAGAGFVAPGCFLEVGGGAGFPYGVRRGVGGADWVRTSGLALMKYKL